MISLEDKIARKIKMIEKKSMNKKEIIKKKTKIISLEEQEKNLINRIKYIIDIFLSDDSMKRTQSIYYFDFDDSEIQLFPFLIFTFPPEIRYPHLERNIFNEYSSWLKYKKHFEEELKYLCLEAYSTGFFGCCINISLKK